MTYSEEQEINDFLDKQCSKSKYQLRLETFLENFRRYGLFGMIKRLKPEREEKEMNKFYKVSIEQYIKDFLKLFPSESIGDTAMIEEIYEMIKLPHRSTSGSAGYDFFAPMDIKLDVNESITIPTGIKCQIDDRWFLGLFPRSGLGFKYNMTLSNTVGIIDADYYDNKDNEGHIMIKLINGNVKPLELEQGKAFAQGIFLPYGITIDDNAEGERIGGIGSTDRKD